MEITCPL